MKGASKIPPTSIRMPEDLKEALKRAAESEGRSLNSETLKRLERTLKEDGFLKP